MTKEKSRWRGGKKTKWIERNEKDEVRGEETADFWGLWGRKSSGGKESTSRWNEGRGGGEALPLFFFFCPTYIFTGNFPKSTRGSVNLILFSLDRVEQKDERPTVCGDLYQTCSSSTFPLVGTLMNPPGKWLRWYIPLIFFFTWGNEDYGGQDVQHFLWLQQM